MRPIMTIIIFSIFSLCLKPTPAKASDNGHEPKELVVLMHGLGRTRASMKTLARKLSKEGYVVLNVDYPSCKHSIEELTPMIKKAIDPYLTPEISKVHFVTHSMGGILVRDYLKKYPLDRLGRVVMLSPPNQGSELVDRFKDLSLFKMIYGPAGVQLGTDPNSIPNLLGPVNFELGVIAGTKSLNPLYSCFIPGNDDGTVAVKRMHVSGQKDFLTVPHSHTFIMNSQNVFKQTAFFLKHGQFNK